MEDNEKGEDKQEAAETVTVAMSAVLKVRCAAAREIGDGGLRRVEEVGLGEGEVRSEETGM